MRDLKADAQTVLREFIVGAFGAQNLGKVEKVYRAIDSMCSIWHCRGISTAKLLVMREVFRPQ